jgi:phosphatidylserine/phosphatidylglycerophosphate/cardiolipin synthase-like enzyme
MNSSPEAASWLKELGAAVNSAAKRSEALIKANSPNSSSAVKNIDFAEKISTFVSKDLPAISWNHGKILAVNGRVVMTGGGNYWNEYMGGQHDILDHQVKIRGDAAISAHEYTNYFFKYLNNLPKTDTRSLLRSCNPSAAKPTWSKDRPAPLANFESSSRWGSFDVLTVGRAGDWHGTMAKLPYPVQVIDAIRDVALNVLWHLAPDEKQGETVAMAEYAVRDDNDLHDLAKTFAAEKLDRIPDMNQLFQDLQVNPVAWASRFARKFAIESAKKRVFIA